MRSNAAATLRLRGKYERGLFGWRRARWPLERRHATARGPIVASHRSGRASRPLVFFSHEDRAFLDVALRHIVKLFALHGSLMRSKTYNRAMAMDKIGRA